MTIKTAFAGDFTAAELYKFVYGDGTTEKFFTSHETSIVYDGDTYISVDVRRTRRDKVTDMSVGQITVTIAIDSTKFSQNDFLNNLVLDNGTLTIYIVNANDVSDVVTDFKGIVADVNINDEIVSITLRDRFHMLKKRFPRLTYNSSACPFIHGDTDCGITLGDFDEVGTADAGSDANTLVDAARAEAANYWQGGILTMTSGANDGEIRTIREYTVVGTMELMRPLPATIAIGDTYSVRPYCNQTFENCNTIFTNTGRIGIYANIPKPQEIYA